MKVLNNIFLMVCLIFSCTIPFNDVNAHHFSDKQVNHYKKAPPFSLKGTDGKTYSLKKGKPLVINFWASWCQPCHMEAPDLVKLSQQYKEIEIYAVNLAGSDTPRSMENFIKKYRLPFPVLIDTEDQVSEDYRVSALPTTFFINKNGYIVDQIIGYRGMELLEEKFQKLSNGD
jgi:cytochrome c biogenesis protein CcmG, thiol:disulfide interchange protein DsbE